jgi:hypothetical protein
MSSSAHTAAGHPSFELPPPPPPEPTKAERDAAMADTDFYSLYVENSNTRSDKLCSSLAKTQGDAAGQPAVDEYFASYYKDDANLLSKHPQHRNFIRYPDYLTHLLQGLVTPEYFRSLCKKG